VELGVVIVVTLVLDDVVVIKGVDELDVVEDDDEVVAGAAVSETRPPVTL
jgi:hypothetical protein